MSFSFIGFLCQCWWNISLIVDNSVLFWKTRFFLRLVINVMRKSWDLYILSTRFRNDYFQASHLNNSGRFSTMVFPFLHSMYIIECTMGSMILFNTPISYLHIKNYFIVNPFTKTFINFGLLSVGEWGFFSLFQKCSPGNYEWVFLKHVYENMDSHFLICSSVDNVLKRTKLPYGGVTPTKEAIFFEENFYWVYLNKDYEDYPTYGYTIY